jgi:hypothetical protein
MEEKQFAGEGGGTEQKAGGQRETERGRKWTKVSANHD